MTRLGRARPGRARARTSWLLLCLTLLSAAVARAEEPAATPVAPRTAPRPAGDRYLLGGQITVIWQQLFKFHSPYSGAHSLRSQTEWEISHTYTLYTGINLLRGLDLYVDGEMARGKGIGDALGLAGYTNGDVIRNPDLGQNPYFARYFLRWTIPLDAAVEPVERDMNQMAGSRATRRLVVTAGKLATTDIFDVNGYANNTRTEFMNWALINSAAYDYAADTRGYTHGLALELIAPAWAVRAGSFQMPKLANGPNLSADLIHNRGDQIEFEGHPRVPLTPLPPAVLRLLGYRNVAHMGDYRASLALAARTGTVPDIGATERTATAKYGFGVNLEQPLADGGDTGLFGRFGWNDGSTESFAYTEADRTLSAGGQLAGRWWRRPDDRLAAAVVQNGLSAAHSDYLAAGGLGFILGDGRLNYAPEQILEVYYLLQPFRIVGVSLDYQFINHPGYNRDRGPVSVLSVRLHLEYW